MINGVLLINHLIGGPTFFEKLCSQLDTTCALCLHGGSHDFNVKLIGLLREWVTMSTRQMVTPLVNKNILSDRNLTTKQIEGMNAAGNLLMEYGKLD